MTGEPTIRDVVGLIEKMDKRFDIIDSRFSEMDGRFSEMDQRFDKMDGRFNKMDDRFSRTDVRFDSLEAGHNELVEQINVFSTSVDARFDDVGKRIARVESKMVTKSYLDDKLADVRGEFMSGRRLSSGLAH